MHIYLPITEPTPHPDHISLSFLSRFLRDQMAEAAMSSLLEQLKEIMIGYKDLISGAENQFEKLNDDLDLLKAFLKLTAEKMKTDGFLGALERRISKVAYEVDDTIDTCLTKAIEIDNKVKTSCRPAILIGSISRFSLAKEVKSIREEKVLPLFDDAHKFANMQEIADRSGGGEYPSVELTRDIPIRQNRVVGFEDDEEPITGYLTQEKESLDVIPVIGIPGQGKTTLAWKIYQNDDIYHHFPIRIWVYISQKFNSRDVFLQILRKFTPSQHMSYLNDELAESVRVCLEKGRFLLVLDDVWSVDVWKRIEKVLPFANGKGKVLITSREMGVGMHFSVYREPHKLQALTNMDSWKLLQYEVFGNLDECPPEQAGMGKLVATKFEGVPLTIAMVGGILLDQLIRFKESPSMVASEWKMVAENVSHAIESDATQRINNAVALSYDRLPYALRDCFVYMGVFPEDYEIPAKMLYGLWISEGFVQSRNGGSLEEAAEENLKDLISRSLVKVEKTNHMGEVKTCRILNMIRAFCINRSQKEGLYQEIRKSSTGALEPPADELRKSYRLCFQSGISEFISKTPYGPDARSFICFDKQPVELDEKYLSVIPDGFPKLRILESRSIKFHQFPTKVTKLIHLRYLTLYIDTLIILPESVSQLWNLRTLVVETKSGSITMKANMWRMHRLRHLRTKAAIVLASKQEGEAGKNLQTLDRLSPESCTEALFKKAKNLKTLGISGKLANILQTGILRELHLLEKLKLVNSLTKDDRLQVLPTQNSFPPNLKSLSLTNTFIDWEHMSTLAKIGTLEVLKLNENAFIGIYWKATEDCFPHLQGLLISYADLVIWEASTESFPSLRSLALENCENLDEIPEAIIHTLERLDIKRVPESAVASARRIVEQKKRAQSGMPSKLSIAP